MPDYIPYKPEFSNLSDEELKDLLVIECRSFERTVAATYIITELNKRKIYRKMKEKIKTREEFEEYIDVEIPCAFFHVMPTDIDDETGAKREDIIMLNVLSERPELLKFESLDWFVKKFITSQTWDK